MGTAGSVALASRVQSALARTPDALLAPLPIDPYIDQIARHLRESRAAVVTAAPGAGKTTRVAPALVPEGSVILLQPRRVAARAIAARIAQERGWTLGREVGWQIRLERRFGPQTRLLVATEGILTARLQQDPLLSEFRTIVLDEFHERSIHADLAIALVRQAWRARDDLRLVIMSATIDSAAIAGFLDGCPVVDVPGRLFPLDVTYREDQPVDAAVVELLSTTLGDLLCFLPGAFEIRRTIADLERRLAGAKGHDVDVVPLYGALDAEAQDAALRASARRRVVVATNLAETSVTVPGVTAVVDAGLHKIARYDAGRGVDTLAVERVTQDAADQRAGRAGRLAPGVVRRLWDARLRLRPHREPEIHRVDLCGAALDVIAWGGDPRRFEWFDAPREDALASAMILLERLELVANGRLTPLGQVAIRLPLHPRLARMLLAANGAPEMARACAWIAERGCLPPRTAATTSDLLSAIDDWHNTPPHVRRVAEDIERVVRHSGVGATTSAAATSRRAARGDSAFRRAILAGYPDRVGRRRAAGSRDVHLASGSGATLAAASGVVGGEFLVAVDVSAGSNRASSAATIRIASLIDREWLTPTGVEIAHRVDPKSGTVKAVEIERYGAIQLSERPAPVVPEVAARLLAEAWLERGPTDADREWIRRLKFAGLDADLPTVVRRLAAGARSLDDMRIGHGLSADIVRALDRDAPPTIAVPSGRSVQLEYDDDGRVSASVKLQALFGLADTPRVGPHREPVRLSLLAPNGRPVQVTRDLRSFWDRVYPDVRKELRGRYPRHPWPEDPRNAPPTARPIRRRPR